MTKFPANKFALTNIPAKHLMALMVLLYSAAMIRWGAIISLHNGFAWDGVRYGKIARNFFTEVFTIKLDTYHVQRIVPSAIVHYCLRLLGISTNENANILQAFLIYNAALLVLGTYVWAGIAGRLQLGLRAQWLGFVALYVNVATMKSAFFNPVVTDTTGFVVGMLVLYFFLAEKPILMMIAGALGSFTWPTMLLMTVPLLAFPRSAAKGRIDDRRLPAVFYCMAAEAVVLGICICYLISPRLDGNPIEPVWTATAPFAGAVVFVYLVAAFRSLVNRGLLERMARFWREMTWSSAVQALILALGVRTTIYLLADSSKVPGNSLKQFAHVTSLISIAKPGIFLLAHVVFFGPIVLVILFCLPRISTLVRAQGLGFTAAILCGVLLSITSESRELLCFFPLFVAVGAKALCETPRARRHDLLFVAASFLLSKCWLPWGAQPLSGKTSDFPWQYYLMNQGPWMSRWSYFVQGAIVLALAGLFAIALRPTKNVGRPDGAEADLPPGQNGMCGN